VVRGGWSRGSVAHDMTGRPSVWGSVTGRAISGVTGERDIIWLRGTTQVRMGCDLAAGKSGPRCSTELPRRSIKLPKMLAPVADLFKRRESLNFCSSCCL
jgi:hypothetical protein